MGRYKSFFHFQHTALDWLWRWGFASVVAGLAALFSRNAAVRHFGLQSLIWGAGDAALALFGQRDALRRIREGARDEGGQARRFRAILLVNALLDVGYVLAGLLLLLRAGERRGRAGAGVGVTVQGLFLLIYDTVLAALVRRWTA